MQTNILVDGLCSHVFDGNVASARIVHAGRHGQILIVESFTACLQHIAFADTLVNAGCSIFAIECFVGRDGVGDNHFVAVFANKRDITRTDSGDGVFLRERIGTTVCQLHMIGHICAALRQLVGAFFQEYAEASVFVAALLGFLDSFNQFADIRHHCIETALGNFWAGHRAELHLQFFTQIVVGEVSNGIGCQCEGILCGIVQSVVLECYSLSAYYGRQGNAVEHAFRAFFQLDAFIER